MEVQSRNSPDSIYGRRVKRAGLAYILWVFVATGVITATGPMSGYFSHADLYFRQAFTQTPIHPDPAETSVQIESPWMWWLVALVTMTNQLASSYAKDIVDPWITTEINDDLKPTIRFGTQRTIVFLSIYRTAEWLDYIVFLFLSLQRIDFMLLGLVADIFCRAWTTYVHLRHKLLLQRSDPLLIRKHGLY